MYDFPWDNLRSVVLENGKSPCAVSQLSRMDVISSGLQPPPNDASFLSEAMLTPDLLSERLKRRAWFCTVRASTPSLRESSRSEMLLSFQRAIRRLSQTSP